jgi:hypothetical protein
MASPYEDYLASLNPLGGPGLNPGMGMMPPDQAGLAGMFKPPVGVGAVPGLGLSAAPVGGLLEEKVPAEGLPDMLLQMQIDKYKNFSDLGQHGIPLTQGSAGAGYDPSKVVQAVRDLVLGGVGMAPKGSAGAFGGKLTADSTALGRLWKGEDMAAEGALPDRIWQETKAFKGPEGEWKYEIPDTPNSITNQATKYLIQGDKVTAPLGEIYKAPGLYEAYPQMAHIPTTVSVDPKKFGGTYYPPGVGQSSRIDAIALDIVGPQGVQGILGHEVQHGIQGIEGFTPGFNPEAAKLEGNQFLDKLKAEMDRVRRGDVSDPYLLGRLQTMYSQFKKNYKPYDAYYRTAGEIEARATQKRMEQWQPYLDAVSPWQTMKMDVAPSKWIVRPSRLPPGSSWQIPGLP